MPTATRLHYDRTSLPLKAAKGIHVEVDDQEERTTNELLYSAIVVVLALWAPIGS